MLSYERKKDNPILFEQAKRAIIGRHLKRGYVIVASPVTSCPRFRSWPKWRRDTSSSRP